MFDKDRFVERLLASRREGIAGLPVAQAKSAEEGGCGVVGFAASVPVRGRHIFEPSVQMHNRGNGKGGGISAACLNPAQLGVDAATLRDDYILQVALLDPGVEPEMEKAFVEPFFRVDHKTRVERAADHREVGLDVRPPDVVRYFVRVRPETLGAFASKNGLEGAPEREVEDEFVYQNSQALNRRFYASLGEQRAFVLSHARNLVIFKVVGYAEQVVQYYGLEDFQAQVWIAHQRYPTKGRVWHPGGAHPFIGLNDALVHNGDFANYYGVSEYLRQHNIVPQFLTDTEVSALLFDLWSRVYKYPLEYVIEGLAPTTELDFDQLPEDKQRVYRALQRQHVAGSPDGPWFFIIARSDADQDRFQLLGITDTSMLRPQVFALQEGEVSIGLVASEKQAIDATLRSLAGEDPRFRLVADRTWNARGGSHTDGGAFVFTVQGTNGSCRLTCTDKFGVEVHSPAGDWSLGSGAEPSIPAGVETLAGRIAAGAGREAAGPVFREVRDAVASWGIDEVRWLTRALETCAGRDDAGREFALELATLLNDRRYDCGGKKPGAVLQLVRECIRRILDAVPVLDAPGASAWRRLDWATRATLRAPGPGEAALVVCARDFPPEGEDCDARLAERAFRLGWNRFIVYGLKGQRFHGCGLGAATDRVRMDLYDSSGDYTASGMDGMELAIHGNGQDQLGQILKSGRLVVHGDVGQAFLYGAKGGQVYVMGNAAGRPLINAVGRPRVVINGSCLDYLAESFMAGDPHNGGGFVILNGVRFDDRGRVEEQETPFPGSNLFSLASGGALFVRDPHRKLVSDQLNGGAFADLSPKDWRLIRPYLETNERLFGISVERDLLTVGGILRPYHEVYRKVIPARLGVLAKQAVPE